MAGPLGRRTLAEFCGTAFLVTIVVGSGIAAESLSPNDVGLQLLENAAATAGGLVALILAFGPVSGAHFNPVVSLADAFFGGLDRRELPAYLTAQVAGAITGAVIANLMFDLHMISWSEQSRSSGGLWLGEVVATIGLLMVIFGVVRSGRSSATPFAVGAYIGAAYFFTSSTSFANPAVTIGRAFSDTFAGIEPASVPAFLAFQLLGGALAVLLIRTLYPDMSSATAADVVAPHTATEATPRPASDHLRDLAKTQGAIVSKVPEILVVCTHNAGRSVAARVLLDHHGQGRVHVRSAGSAPGEGINPAVAQLLTERGLDTSKEFPKPLTDEAAQAADVIITMGCGDACPVYQGKRYLDWELTDPAGKGIDEVRPIVDEIERRAVELLEQLLTPTA
jgi:arsenate reductase (thioredoxin)